MTQLSSTGARAVQDALRAKGINLEVVELPQSTRTAAEAAAAVGCSVAQIAKSLVFRGAQSNQAVLVIASGANRVDERLVADVIGEPIAKADAAFVREQTGFAIGGVPPVGHRYALRTFIDRDLLAFEEIWAAAGTPNAVFRLTPTDLLAITDAEVINVR